MTATRGQCIGCIAFEGGAGATPETDPETRRGNCALDPSLAPFRVPLMRVSVCTSSELSKTWAGKRVNLPSAGGPGTYDDEAVEVTPRATLNNPTTGNTEGEIDMDRDGLKEVLRELLEEETLYGYPEMAKKYQGGTLLIKPADSMSFNPKRFP